MACNIPVLSYPLQWSFVFHKTRHVYRHFENQFRLCSQKFSKIIATRFSKTSQEVTITITKGDRNHDRSYSCCFQVMRSDSRTTRRKNRYHEFVTYLEALSKCTAWTSDWVNQNPPQHVPIMPRTTEKNFDDFVTYPESTQQLYCMDFSLGEPERICNMFL